MVQFFLLICISVFDVDYIIQCLLQTWIYSSFLLLNYVYYFQLPSQNMLKTECQVSSILFFLIVKYSAADSYISAI